MLKNGGYEFVEQTKYANLSETGQKIGIPQPPYEIPMENDKPLIDLPDPASIQLEDDSLRRAIEERRTLRHYVDDQLSLEELTYLLWLSQGVKEVDPKRNVVLRTVPSAGCRHPFETYLSTNRVQGLRKGLYRYIASINKLVVLHQDENFNEQLAEACLGQRHVATSAVTFIWTAVPYRAVWRYGERSYRYIYLDAGHVCQNLSLSAESIGCGVCSIGAFDDDAANRLMSFNPPEIFVCYMATLGRRG